MKPYYMYRQKNMVGNFENVGYCTFGKECIYNVQIMEEKQNVIAAGAGASTKIVYHQQNSIPYPHKYWCNASYKPLMIIYCALMK